MTTGNASNSAALRREVRIGLVLYGGVSLAIYIYGVCLEFLKVVRASAELETERNVGGKKAPGAYAEVLRSLNAKAVVDIIAGTSAGGINGVALAKALVLDGRLDDLRRLWVDEGDFERLLNPIGRANPESLLNADRYESMVRDALDEIDAANSPACPYPRVQDPDPAVAPPFYREGLVPVLDLFVTATNLYGRLINSEDYLGHDVQTKDYRKAFHRKLRTREYRLNHFTAEYNATLAKLCHATSSFPVAIAPLTASPGDLKDIPSEDGEDTTLYLADGGILDNKPFTHMLRTIFSRTAEGLVDRVVFYVEPDPEPVDKPATEPRRKPDFLTVARLAATGIPTYESIDQDLRAIQDHNAQVQRLTEALRSAAAQDTGLSIDPDTFWEQLRQQHAWRVYDNLKVADLKRQLEQGFFRTVGHRNSNAQAAFRCVLNARTVGAKDRAAFLSTFDLAYQVRRSYHVVETLVPLYGLLAERGLESALKELKEKERGLWEVMAAARYAQWAAWEMATDDAPDRIAADLRPLRSVRSVEDAIPIIRRYVDRVQKYLDDALDRQHPNPKMPAVRTRGLAVCKELDELFAPFKDDRSELSRSLPKSFSAIWSYYEPRDIILYPLGAVANLGERDRIDLVRISPDAAQFIPREPRTKLAGDAVMHFGGFFKREWRQNDILWGRLDAAELIVRTLAKNYRPPLGGPPLSEGDLHGLIRKVQTEVLREEHSRLKGESPSTPLGVPSTILDKLDQAADYREFLGSVERFGIGNQGLGAIGLPYALRVGGKSARVLGNMARTAKERPGASIGVRFVTGLISRVAHLAPLALKVVSLFRR